MNPTNELPPMTELVVAQSIQRSIAELDLTSPQAQDCCANLISKLEGLLWKIKTDAWDEEEAHIASLEAEGKAEREAVWDAKQALRAICCQGFDHEVAS